ncbi:hypothetical protein AwWohl_14480 [Gammaproteobacteria bacterium]|nr:hypothetical protein AwWohl_14480 [Gammaproteobacteria bacterium]
MPTSSSSTSTDAKLGRFNRLQIIKYTDFGLYLWDEYYGDILLPKRYIPKNKPTEIEDWLEVFLYLDSEDRVIATTQIPKAQVGKFAVLKVIEINKIGIFLDWGLPKDILMPYAEAYDGLQVGDSCIVYVYLDARSKRITATEKFEHYLDREKVTYNIGDKVKVLVVKRTDMGFNAIIEHKHWGLIHNNELFKSLKIGMREFAFIKEIRADGKINLSLQLSGPKEKTTLEETILSNLEEQNGVLLLSDKSSPQEIVAQFNVSKANFKKALGSLYKQGLIKIENDKIIKI